MSSCALGGQQILSRNLAAAERREDLRDVNLNNFLLYYQLTDLWHWARDVVEINSVSRGTRFLEQKTDSVCRHY